MTEYFDYENEAEEKKYDELTEKNRLTPIEARAEILRARRDSIGRSAVATFVEPTEKKPNHHYSRRGGRSYSEPSDSEQDPFWNVQGAAAPMDDDQKAAFDVFKADSEQAAKQSLVKNGMSSAQADAIMVARRNTRQ